MSCDSPEVFGSIPLDVIILYLSDISWSCDLLLNSEGTAHLVEYSTSNGRTALPLAL
jgi:hypothetical protein